MLLLFNDEPTVKIRIILITLALLSVLLPAQAVEVADLYVSRMTESDVRKLGEEEAKIAAFSQMLVRVSGKRAVLDDEIIRQQYTHLNNYLKQFGFIETDGRRLYEVSFNPNAVNRLLRQANMPIWESKRPYTLIWLAQEQDDGERYLINEQAELLANSTMVQVAKQRGLPFSFPLLDLDELMQVSASDVWGNFAQPMLDASARYDADQFILAKIFSLGEQQYRLNWAVYNNDSAQPLITHWQRGELTGALPTIMGDWVEAVADQYGQRFAVQTLLSEGDRIELEIYNLASLPLLLQAERLLADLAMVSSVQLNQLDTNRSVFTINILGREQDLIEALELDPHFLRIVSNEEDTNTISYMWQM